MVTQHARPTRDSLAIKQRMPKLLRQASIQRAAIDEVRTYCTRRVLSGYRKLNVDENPGIAQKFGIMSIPTVMIFKNGTVVKQFVGVQSKETLLGELNKLIN